MFITFEGIDGSGKSTQMLRLADFLRDQGKTVITTRDPGGTEVGMALRQIVLHHKGFVSPRCELFLYLADRAQHVDEKIRPALEQGTVVLCDRYIDSTMAYQGGGRGISLEKVREMNTLATSGLKPDRTFLLDAPVEILLERTTKRGEKDRLEQETVDFYQQVRTQYLALAKEEPDRIVVLDATLPVDCLHQQIIQSLTPCVT